MRVDQAFAEGATGGELVSQIAGLSTKRRRVPRGRGIGGTDAQRLGGHKLDEEKFWGQRNMMPMHATEQGRTIMKKHSSIADLEGIDGSAGEESKRY